MQFFFKIRVNITDGAGKQETVKDRVIYKLSSRSSVHLLEVELLLDFELPGSQSKMGNSFQEMKMSLLGWGAHFPDY